MQCVILAGGLGTRMLPLTAACAKTLLPVAGHPFAWHQLHWLASQGVGEVVYCIGHLGGQIRRYWDAQPQPLSIRYVDEGAKPLGTGGALRLALERNALADSFLVLYGDSYLPVEIPPIWRAFQSSGLPALMTVLRNDGKWDASNVIYDQDRIILYDKLADPAVRSQMQHIDYGLSALRRDALYQASKPVFDLAALFRDLSLRGELAGFEVHQRFYEIGSPEGLRDLEAYLARHDQAPAPC